MLCYAIRYGWFITFVQFVVYGVMSAVEMKIRKIRFVSHTTNISFSLVVSLSLSLSLSLVQPPKNQTLVTNRPHSATV